MSFLIQRFGFCCSCSHCSLPLLYRGQPTVARAVLFQNRDTCSLSLIFAHLCKMFSLWPLLVFFFSKSWFLCNLTMKYALQQLSSRLLLDWKELCSESSNYSRKSQNLICIFPSFHSLCSLFLHLLWTPVSHAFHHLKLFLCFLQILLTNPTFFEVFLSQFSFNLTFFLYLLIFLSPQGH